LKQNVYSHVVESCYLIWWKSICDALHCKKPVPKIRNKYFQKYVCEWFIYSYDRSPYSAAGNMRTDPGNIQYKSFTDT
jgi:hypothetical protein